MPPEKGVHVGVCCIVYEKVPQTRTAGPPRGQRIAMLKRAGKEGIAKHGSGTWSVPGGWVDFGERPVDTAKREVQEEVGLRVSTPRFHSYVTNTHPDDDLHVVCLVFEAYQVDGELTNLEPEKCDGVEWVPVESVASRSLFAPLKTFITENRGKI